MAQMAALGVPAIASPTPDNRRLHELGVGLMAGSVEEWSDRLGELLGDEALRNELAQRGRSAMRTETYERHASSWWHAWTKGL
jgi:Glycosyl transferases group 1